MAQRQSAISYRDSVLYDDFVTHKAQFPISSLMTHGIIKGKANMLGGEKEDIEDWRDEVVHYYGVGNMMYELYISPEILSAEEMDVLGNVTKWAMANAHPLLDNTTMVGGDPAQRKPYGFVHSNAEKSIVMLRNPFVRPQTIKLKIDEENGFTKFLGDQELYIAYPYSAPKGSARFGATLTFELGAYEEIVAEIRTAFSVNAGTGPIDSGPQVLFSPASLRRGADLSLSAKVEVPDSYPQARFAVLFEPDQEKSGLKADAVDSGKPLELTTENGGRGVWYWYFSDLPPGKHSIELTIHSSAHGHVSAWLITRRDLGGGGPPGVLPPQPNIVRGTHLLLEETIR